MQSYTILFKSDLLGYANGTVFKQDIQGRSKFIERWYAERKILQQIKRESEEGDKEKIALDKRQLVKKINLNSIYGAILTGCRFYDKRIGQSTTLTGRCITRHIKKQMKLLKAHMIIRQKVYGDTDSIYYSMYPISKRNR